MTLITSSDDLAAFCDRMMAAEYIAIDTEFMREHTFWPKLCLVQIAGLDEAVAIDPLAPGIDLAPLFTLVNNPKVLKVFHSARQDVEIFVHLTGQVPKPLFDTQVAAMVCGFGESVSYENLVGKLANARIDKSSRFTDWSHRPLTERQIEYALADVIHLRPAYEALRQQLGKSGRESWLDEEMAILCAPETYHTEPDQAWLRLKPRNASAKFLAILHEVAAWREREAQKRDIPRGRILKDEALLEIAAHSPRDIEGMARVRGMSRNMAEGWQGQGLIAAVERGLATPPEDAPKLAQRPPTPPGIAPLVELMRVLLKMKCEDEGVAQKLVAGSDDLEAIAMDDDADVPALHGWRRAMFGDHALALKRGAIALAVQGRRIRVVTL
jgi:ribonuclease D